MLGYSIRRGGVASSSQTDPICGSIPPTPWARVSAGQYTGRDFARASYKRTRIWESVSLCERERGSGGKRETRESRVDEWANGRDGEADGKGLHECTIEPT